MKPHELKALQVRLKDAQVDYSRARQVVSDAQRACSEAQKRVARLEADIAVAGTIDLPVVSEHALLRFVERVYGVDLAVLQSAILTEQMVALIDAMKTGRFPIEGYDCYAVVKNRVIVTIET